uniref:protein-tyrosine-phosphatase n=1 Tax=Phallusia mammillata TaxID=59560 RepID=A0A6F9DQ77_9ASCI|nr:tyrosine-protein phosphatase non-receptor type 14-like [Phallusia mammillata]
MLDKAINTVIMPFGIKLKRTGRYILSHKNSFLIRVQLLDNSVMECTLTVENTGSDCLNAVAQKLELREIRYFGLKYINKLSKERWVELDKPLKKQVDKNAQEPNLFFGIMFYIANIDRLQQEIARYLYYLQMKNNVISGGLKCNTNEAVELASYVLQAEFGDHDETIHNVEYFRDYILFSETLTPTEEALDGLTMQTIELHKKHRGLSASDAEYNYILKSIHLDGFSEDLQLAKNESNHDIEVGSSFAGVVIKPVSKSRSTNYVCHEWEVVEQISHSKSSLVVEIRHTDSSLSSLHFHMEDGDTAKYAYRMLETKRKFYQQNKDSLKRKMPVEITSLIQRRPTLRRHQDTNESEGTEQVVPVHAGRSAEFVSSQENLQMYESQFYSSETSDEQAFVSQTSLNQFNQHEAAHSNGYIVGGSMYSSPSINSLSQSQIGLPSPATSNLSINSSDRRLAPGVSRVGLPIYRHSPDYDIATQQRRRYSSYLENNPSVVHGNQSSNHQHPNMGQSQAKPRPHSMIYSPQELLHQVANGPPYAQYPQQHTPLYYTRSQPFQDSIGQAPSGPYPRGRQREQSVESVSPPNGAGQQFLNNPRSMVSHDGPMNNPVRTGSTPELPNTLLQQQRKPYFMSELQLHQHYPINPTSQQGGAGSTSTPDLTQHRYNGVVSASTPELHVVPELQRHHPPLPPAVENYTENVQHNQSHISSSFDHTDHHRNKAQQQTPEQNVQAYLQQVTGSDQHFSPPEGTAFTTHMPQMGSREHLLNDGRQQQIHNPNQISGYQEHPSNNTYQQYGQQPRQQQYHHSHDPSTATMLVYDSDSDDITEDYLLSQQLQDQAAHNQAQRVTRSDEFLSTEHISHLQEAPENHLVQSLQQINISDPTVNSNPPPPYPDQFVIGENVQPNLNQGFSNEYQQGQPPEGSVFDDIDNSEDEMPMHDNDSFPNARRSTFRKMPPMKFASANGLNVSRRSSSPVKGEPDERVINLEEKVEEGHVLTEYDKILRMRENSEETQHVKEVVPYQDNRVEISTSSENPQGYYNASHIKVMVAGQCLKYIASKSPTHGQEHEFWELVWRNNCTIIVLISKEIEHGKPRCARYWPSSEDNQDIPSAVFGDFKVMCRFDNCPPSNAPESCITRNLVLEKVDSSEKRTIWMLQYIGWPETGVPKDPLDFLVFMEELDSVRRLAQENNSDSLLPPVVVQCTSGAGRSGVLILAELMIQCLEHNQDTSIDEMLGVLRHQRMHMVQTFSQYNFVYKLLIAFLRKSRLI